MLKYLTIWKQWKNILNDENHIKLKENFEQNYTENY